MNTFTSPPFLRRFAALFFLFGLGLNGGFLQAQTYTTVAGDNGANSSWSNLNTWSPAGHPDGTTAIANLSSVTNASTLDLGGLTYTVNSLNIAAGTGTWAVNNGTLTFSGAAPSYSDHSAVGANTISASVVLDADTTFNVGSTSGTTISGAISDSRVTKAGAGTLTLSGTNNYIGGTTIDGGTLQVSSESNLGNAAGGLTLNGGQLAYLGTTTLSRH